MLWKSNRSTEFQPEQFQNPPQANVPVYFWVWNGILSKEEICKQMDEMERLGIKAFYIVPESKDFRPTLIPSRLEPDYLSGEYFQYYAYVCEQAKQRNMTMWLYNESGWPSGSANSRIVMDNPDLARHILTCDTRKCIAGERYSASSEILAAFLHGTDRIMDGYICEEDCDVTEFRETACFFSSPHYPEIPDLTRKESTQAFLKLVHNQYQEYIGDYFGNVIQMVFTDEPAAPRPMPFHKALRDEFEDLFGVDILDWLPYILNKTPTESKAKEIRVQWYNFISQKFCKSYLETEKAWCHTHNLLYCGHLDCDDHPTGWLTGGNYHILRGLRCFDVPGVDVIGRQIFPVMDSISDLEYGKNSYFPRFASSAAAQNGSGISLTESFAVYGNGLTFAQMRYVIGFQAVRGINLFDPALIPYARKGFFNIGEAPFFTEKHGCYRYLSVFNTYLERLSYVNSLGRMANDVALFLPMNDLWMTKNDPQLISAFDQTALTLEKEQISFDIIDDDVILQANIAGNKLIMGLAEYSHLIFPCGAWLSEEVQRKLADAAAAGVHIYLVKPFAVYNIPGAIPISKVNGLLAPKLSFACYNEDIRLLTRQMGNGTLHLLFNQSAETTTFRANLPKNSYYLDLDTGKILPASQCGETRLESGEICCLLVSSQAVKDAETESSYQNQMSFSRFEIKPISEMKLGLMDISLETPEANWCETKLGAWTSVVPESFTGTCVYRTSFDKPEKTGRTVQLDLGDVRYTAEVYLNKEKIGTRIYPPYCFTIPAEQLLPDNTLEIHVTNTAANQYVLSTQYRQWPRWMFTPYQDKQEEFDRTSLSSGLYGDVVLRF